MLLLLSKRSLAEPALDAAEAAIQDAVTRYRDGNQTIYTGELSLTVDGRVRTYPVTGTHTAYSGIDVLHLVTHHGVALTVLRHKDDQRRVLNDGFDQPIKPIQLTRTDFSVDPLGTRRH